MVRFENDMNEGMQRTYDELVYQMGIEIQGQVENGGFVSGVWVSTHKICGSIFSRTLRSS